MILFEMMLRSRLRKQGMIKIVEEENEDTETDHSLDGLRRSGREKIPTKNYTKN
jgi:hypothetical protein